jgi:hypothetical protein
MMIETSIAADRTDPPAGEWDINPSIIRRRLGGQQPAGQVGPGGSPQMWWPGLQARLAAALPIAPRRTCGGRKSDSRQHGLAAG